MMDNVIGFIFARGGSKGVPGKNIRPLGGRPLIAHAIQAGLECRALQRIVVSTDCPEIARIARSCGAEVPFLRPPLLASDTAPERLAWRHAIEQVEQMDQRRVDTLVSIPATCPLRAPEDIDRCVAGLMESSADIALTVTPASSNPYFNMVTRDKRGFANVVLNHGGPVHRRQEAPTVFDLTAVAYAARRDPIFTYDTIFESRVLAIEVPPERAIDIDTELDWKFAEFLFQHKEAVTSPGLQAA